ncbi:hypothetical protein SARC_05040 [Sphaeroforma arctica JP610]|uniref:RING-type domain-containing protein n=1 Tax=Sphaeroforma arctica JP610 TaxID=667725 RepID=A0A0L0G1J5_9EUKA|nr:hypothetical protein SARC_05040 [Sphaeroforma arctica JP610]KNC82681.1 hypothetical protein SARC_05040 [Sphaeroforma arctica JP610]|eukprot:XP_014156583.1 hypothetical protein SARC_05040 [Sphaeroforma arctica JP610]
MDDRQDNMSSKRTHDDIEARSEAIKSETAADIEGTHHIPSDVAQEPAEALPGEDKSTIKRARIESVDNTDVSTEDSLNVHTQANVKTDPVEVGTAGTPVEDTLASGIKTEATTTGIEGSTSESEQAGVKVEEATSVSGVKVEDGSLSGVKVEGTLPDVADTEEDLAQSGIKEDAAAEGFEIEIAEEAGTVKTEDVPEETSGVKSEYTGDTVNTDESVKSEDVAPSNVEDEIVPHSVKSENTGEGDHMDTEEAVKTEETPASAFASASASASAEYMASDESGSASTAQADSTDNEPPEATIERLRQHAAAYRSAMVCSICSEILVKPHSLECGHSYCVTCICTYFSVRKAMGRGLQCKQCNNPIRKKPEPSLVLQTRINILRKQPCADIILKNYSARLKTAQQAMKSDEYKSITPGTELVDHEGKGYVFDKGDDVYRCIECLFEIEDYKCAGCGVAFPELENRSDVHRELGVSDSQEDGEDSEDDEGDDGADLKNFIVGSDEEIEMEKPEEGEQPLKGWITNQSGLKELMCGCDVSCGQDCECDDEDCTACPCAQRNLNDGSGEDSDSDYAQDDTHWDGGSDDGSVRSKSDHRGAKKDNSGANKDNSVAFKDMSKTQRKNLKEIRKANKILEANGVENIDSLSKNQRLKLLKNIRADRKAAAKAAKDTVAPNTGAIAEPIEGFVLDRAGAYATENSAATADGDAVVRGDGEGDNGNREEGELSDTYRNRMNEHSEESRKIHDVKAAWPRGDLVEHADGGENIEDGGSDEFESGADEMERDEDDDDDDYEGEDEDEDMEGVEDPQEGEVEEGEVDAEDGEDAEEEDGEDLGESDGEDE